MSTILYLKLSALMFMEYAVWGAWMPVLAARLLGPLQMSGKQTGWIYATLPLASMISPLFAGQLADKYVDTGLILTVCHGLGTVLLFLSARITKFKPLFLVMLAYAMLYAATIPLVNSLMFSQLTDVAKAIGQEPRDFIAKHSPGIFIWAPIAWALIGYMLSGYRNLRKAEGDGSDCLKFGAILSILMAVICLLQPATPPKGGEGVPMLKALSMLSDYKFAIFIVVSMVVAGTMQFYFLGTARYLSDKGASGKNVPAIMGIAQAAQAVATMLALGLLLTKIGPKWTITVGAASWMTLYIAYCLNMPKWAIVLAQVFHGLAYVFFIIGGQIYISNVAPKEIAGSAQALIILVTTGIGLFLGTQVAGFSMDRFSAEGKINWSKVFLIPLLCTLFGVLALAVAF
ncbi:MAG: MFS transporter [Verrucomicrobia bacterium]|nr:MFS transporter [Verrucomicrobiota bacterium]